MRLTSFEIKSIKKTFLDVFKEGKIYLFGSRVDDTKKGGDIDLYLVPVTSNENEGLKKVEFLIQLESLIGEQKIDVVIAKDRHRSIEKIAIKEGILLNSDTLKIDKYLHECDKHIIRINKAFNKIKDIFPLSGEKYASLNDDEVAMIDQYLFRFSKLQDTVGEKLFRFIVKDFVENIDSMSFIDILNRLEKIGIITHVNSWKRLRKIRNDIAHQYDDDPEEMAGLINNIFAQREILINVVNKIKEYFKNS